MPQFQGLSACVEMEGTKLDEYGIEVDERQKTVTCWVPCEADKSFQFVVTPDAPRSTHHLILLRLDGRRPSPRRNVLKKDSPAESICLADERISPSSARSFHFASLTLTDDDAYLNSANSQLGEIACLVYTVDDFVEDPSPQTEPPPYSETRVHERSKKGLAHCIKYGEESAVTPPLYLTSVNQVLAATFVFKYRNMDILIASGIAPRRAPVSTSSAPPAEADQNLSASSTTEPAGNSKKRTIQQVKEECEDEDEDMVLVEEERALKARLAEIEAKRSEKNSSSNVKRVKKEHKSAFIPGEVIDLTL